MTLVIGTDEAGYGPNLGPLIVAATAWLVDAPADETEARIAAAVHRGLAATRGESRLATWADSKQVYRAGLGRETLEHGALAAVAIVAGRVPRSWDSLCTTLGPIGPGDLLAESPEWGSLHEVRLPIDADAAKVEIAASSIAEGMASEGVRLVAVACRGLYPGHFNRLLDGASNKSDILSRETLDLAASLSARHDALDEETLVWCDRHGGRKRYATIVEHVFGGAAECLEESSKRSCYSLNGRSLFEPTPSGRTMQIEFVVGGEARTPVALASMTAKFVREVTMAHFNRFWQARAPGLAATAGYPVDARRWRTEAADAIHRAGVPEERLWRRV